MVGSRWSKILGDLWSSKTRTALVVLSIAVGVFAVGMIAESGIRMSRGLSDGYLAGTPFSAAFATKQTFDEDLLEVIRDMPEVEEAEGRRTVSVRLNTGPNQWETLVLAGIDDFDDMRVGKMRPQTGAWPPADKELLIERSALSERLSDFHLQVGDIILIETPDRDQRRMRISGSVHDLNVPPTFIFGVYFGYITLDTVEWLGQSRDFNSLQIRVAENPTDREHVARVAKLVRDKIEKSGIEVESTFIAPEPDKSPIASFGLDPIILILSTLGGLSVILSGFLVTNTISALLGQQLRQIGVMKTIGARRRQIISMYITLVLIFGLLAILVAAPLASLGAGLFVDFFAGLFNFDPIGYGVIWESVALMALVSLLVPVLASIQPLLRGTGITVREAISGYGLGKGQFGSSRIDRILLALGTFPLLRHVGRPALLSLRNTFRRKGRLALTMVTLTLGGATFIAVFTVQASVTRSLDELFASLVRFDISMDLENSYRVERIRQEALSIEGIERVESWGFISARRLRPDDTESDTIVLQAPPTGSDLIAPMIVQGRNLLPNDENALLVSTGVIDDEPDIGVGSEIILKFKGRETTWRVVGVFNGLGSDLFAYANYNYFAEAVREIDQSSTVRFITTSHDPETQTEIARQLEEHFRAIGLNVTSTTTAAAERDEIDGQFAIITNLLLIMAVLTAIVGGLGLAGTMSMNVLERTREIGVMRAIGASTPSLLRIVIGEGMIIGMLSWGLAVLLALPISRLLSDGVGMAFLGAPLSYTFSVSGSLLWLGLAMLVAAVASSLPAWRASRLTVRDVLAYE